MPRPTPSKTVRQALVEYSDDRRDRNRSRSRSRDKDKRRTEQPRQSRPESQRIEIKTREQGQQSSRSKGVGLRRKSVLKEASPVPAAKGETPLELSETVAPLPIIPFDEDVPTNEEMVDALKNIAEEPSVLQEEIQPAESPSSVIMEGSVEGENLDAAEKADTTSLRSKRSKGVLSQIKTWIIGKHPSTAGKDRLSTVEESTEENVAEYQDEESPIDNLVKSSMGALASIESFVADEEANTIRFSDKDASSIQDLVELIYLFKMLIDDFTVDTGNSVSTGTADKSEICEQLNHKRCKRGAWFSSTPKYSMHLDMKDGDKTVQTRFIQKIFTVYLLKALAMFTVTYLVVSYQELFDEVLEDPNTFPFHLISLGFYLFEKVIIRLAAKVFRNARWLHVVLILLEIIAICDITSFVLVAYLNDDMYRIATYKILYSITMTSLYFIIVGFFVTFDMRDQVMMCAAAIIAALACIHQVIHNMTIGVHPEHFDHRTRWVDEIYWTFASLTVVEFIILFIMWELKRILTGQRFPNVASNDWALTSVYLI